MDRPGIDEFLSQAREHQRTNPEALELPAFTQWPTWPFEGGGRVRAISQAVLPEAPRKGEGGVDCGACNAPDREYLWVNDDWRVRATKAPTGLPVILFLEPRVHADSDELPDHLLDGLGRVLRRVDKALMSLGDIARVQMARWGDGGEHFHMWFFPRPLGFAQGRGSFLSMWDDVLPPRPLAEWEHTLVEVAAALRAG